jgi:hypothetical protein
VTKVVNVTIGNSHRVQWELSDGELLLCTIHPWGNPMDVWANRVTLEETPGDSTRLSIYGESSRHARIAFIPFGSVVVFKEKAL